MEAGNLLVGDKLISANSDDLLIEDYHIALTEEPVSVYNFQVEDFHTYFVGNCAVWVHNAECTPKEYIDSVESGETELKTNKQKGNYGEMKMDQYYEGQGYERVSLDSIESLDDPIHHGIDGVYHKADGEPPYVVAEAKYGSSQLSNTKSSGKQMSERWITDRLESAVGKDLADEILLEGYDRQLIRVNVGEVTVKSL
ncbi:MAG: polymorphic toxin-type HINT domain-containing protein [Ruminococcus flavefaciens]|nr:polymorphic toxin-type HINT domain-containing protein [Ruminococcus flavefaciens]